MRVIEQWLHRACGVSTLVHIENPTGHGPEEPALADPDQRRETVLERPLQIINYPLCESIWFFEIKEKNL